MIPNTFRHALVLASLFTLVCCALPPEDGTIVVDGPGGGAAVGNPAVVAGPDSPQVGLEPGEAVDECPWQGEWFTTTFEDVSHRMNRLIRTPNNRLLAFGSAEYPGTGWFALDATTDVSADKNIENDIVFWDSDSFRAAPVILPVDDALILAGTRNGHQMSVQRRQFDGTLDWSTDVELDEPGPKGQTVPTANVIVPTDDGIVILGTAERSSCCGPAVMATSLTESGDLRWIRTYTDDELKHKDENYEYPIAGFFDAEGNVVVASIDFQAGTFDLWLMALNADGERVWEVQHSGWERGPLLKVFAQPGGGYAVVGTVPSKWNGGVMKVTLLGSRGEIRRELHFSEGDHQEVIGAAHHSSDGSIVILGYSSQELRPVVWHLNHDATNVSALPYDLFEGSVPTLLTPIPGGGWMLGGHNYEGFERGGEFARLNTDGSVGWRYKMGSERYTTVKAIEAGPDGTITAAGTFWDKQNTHTGWLMRLDERCRIP